MICRGFIAVILFDWSREVLIQSSITQELCRVERTTAPFINTGTNTGSVGCILLLNGSLTRNFLLKESVEGMFVRTDALVYQKYNNNKTICKQRISVNVLHKVHTCTQELRAKD